MGVKPRLATRQKVRPSGTSPQPDDRAVIGWHERIWRFPKPERDTKT